MRRMVLLALAVLILVSPTAAEVPHENYDRAQLNLKIVHLFLQEAYGKAEAALRAAAEQRLEEAQENLTYFRGAMESAMKTLEEVNPSVPSYSLIEREMENISALYQPLLDVVGGFIQLQENLREYTNYTLPLPGALLTPRALLENLTEPYHIYTSAGASLSRALRGVASLKEALQNISRAYDTRSMEENLTRVKSLLEGISLPPFHTTILTPIVELFEGEMASTLLLIPGGTVDPPLPDVYATSISGAFAGSEKDLKRLLQPTFLALISEYTSLKGLAWNLPLLYRFRENITGPFLRRVDFYHRSVVLVAEQEGYLNTMEEEHTALRALGVGAEEMGGAIETVRLWLDEWRRELLTSLNLSEELVLLSQMISDSVGAALWDYDRDGDKHLDPEEIINGWSLEAQEERTGELEGEVSSVERAIQNYTSLFNQSFLSTFKLQQEAAALCQEFLENHLRLLSDLEDAIKNPTLESVEVALGSYGALNSTYLRILESSEALREMGYPLLNTSLQKAFKMLDEYRRLLNSLILTLPGGLILYTSRPSYPLGDTLQIMGRAHMNGTLRGWRVNLTLLGENYTLLTGSDGSFSLSLPIDMNTPPGVYTAVATLSNMTARCTFTITLIPVRLSLTLGALYATPGENISYTATAEDLWGAGVNSTLYVDGEPYANLSGGGEGIINISSFGLHPVELRFSGDPFRSPASTPTTFINISLPLTLRLIISDTTLYRNSSVNLTLLGAPSGRYVEFISQPPSLNVTVLVEGEEANLTLMWGDLPPGEYLIQALYTAQDPVYRDSRSPPVLLKVVDQERPSGEKPPGAGGGGEEVGGGEENESIMLPKIVPVPGTAPTGGDNLLLYAALAIWAAAIAVLLLYTRARRSGGKAGVRIGPPEPLVEDGGEGGGEEEVPAEGVVVAVEAGETPPGASDYYFRVVQWARGKGVPVEESHTPGEFLSLFTDALGENEHLRRFIEVFERYTYGPLKREEDLKAISSLAESITGVGV